MKIKVYYEDKNHPTILDIPDAECNIMVETDYRQRREAAEDKSAVKKRTLQEIMDEDFNKPNFNNNQSETRRHVLLSALDPKGESIAGDGNIPDEYFIDLHCAIEKLQPQQKMLIHKIFWQGIKQVEIAKEEGVEEAAISRRLSRIYAKLKKILEK